MRRRISWIITKISFAVPVLIAALGLSGCDGDYYYKKGQYDKAYVEYVKQGGVHETALKNEVANGSFATRNAEGNKAIHDYYYAADSQKKLGNTETAKLYYKRVVDLSTYNIRIPQDKSAILKDDFGNLEYAIRNFRNREVYLSTHQYDDTDPYSGGGSDPYSGGGSSGGSDPYSGGSSGGGSDPYSGGSSGGSDPYSGGSSGGSTDPYGGGSGGNTDPYSLKVQASVSPNDDWQYRSYFNNILTYRQNFERKLYSSTAQEIPDIENVKREYERFSRALDTYLTFAAPGGLLQSPNSLGSAITYAQLESAMSSFRRTLYSAKGVITYINQPLNLTEPQLVATAKAELGTSAAAPRPVSIPSGVKQDNSTDY